MISGVIDLVTLVATVLNTAFLVVIFDRLKWRK
jgi:hypothetical protein